MSVQTPYLFNRNEKCQILSPDFLSLPFVAIDTNEFIDSGIIIDIEGKPATLTNKSVWIGLVLESNYYNTSGGKVLKPSGNVIAYFSNMVVATKQFTDDADAPIAKGDLLTVVNGKLQKTDDTHTVVVAQVTNRGSDYIEVAFL